MMNKNEINRLLQYIRILRDSIPFFVQGVLKDSVPIEGVAFHPVLLLTFWMPERTSNL